MLHHVGAEAARNLDRLVGRERVDNYFLVAEPRALQALADQRLFVARNRNQRNLWPL
jgi:protein required for attachment to host cells